MDNLNEFLTNLRKKNYTLDKIAELIPVSKQGYFNWEKGHRDWKLDVLIKLSAILNFERNQSGTFSHLFLGGGSPLFISLEIN